MIKVIRENTNTYKTVSGRNARIICDDRKGFGNKNPVMVLIMDNSGNEVCVAMPANLQDVTDSQWFPDENLSLIKD